MDELYEKLTKIVSLDPGSRGLLDALEAQDAAGAAELLRRCHTALIVTGFTIASAGVGETDGPIGAAAIARALLLSGRGVHVLTDRWSVDAVRACLEAVGARCQTHVLEHGSEDAPLLAQLIDPDLIIAIERPGKGRDGHFHNMRGEVIDELTADTDELLTLGIPVIAVGDGGNELGMGNYIELIGKHVRCGARIAAAKTSDVALVAGVSNWWGWGLAAILSALEGRDLMTGRADELRCLAAAAAVGAVDGVSGKSELSVDGVLLGGIDEVHAPLRAALREALKNR